VLQIRLHLHLVSCIASIQRILIHSHILPTLLPDRRPKYWSTNLDLDIMIVNWLSN